MKQTSLFTFAETDEGFTPLPAAMDLTPAAPKPLAETLRKELRASATSSASFSPCRLYRYMLLRRWGSPVSPRVLFIGLNPSTADEERDDNTIRREVRYAMEWGYGGLLKANLYGYRSTNPKGLKVPKNPIDHLPGFNDRVIAAHASRCELVVAAWGAFTGIDARAAVVLRVLNRPVYCLGRSKDGAPRHPLMLSAARKPELFWTPAGELNHGDTEGTEQCGAIRCELI